MIENTVFCSNELLLIMSKRNNHWFYLQHGFLKETWCLSVDFSFLQYNHVNTVCFVRVFLAFSQGMYTEPLCSGVYHLIFFQHWPLYKESVFFLPGSLKHFKIFSGEEWINLCLVKHFPEPVSSSLYLFKIRFFV